jgi:hypothetical protein
MKASEGSPASDASAADAAPALHDDAGPDRPSTEGPPRAQTRAMRTGGTAGRPITVATDEDSDDEDSDEKLDDSQDEGSQGTAETIALLELGVGGQQYYDWESHCLVRLGQKVSGRTLLCGYLKNECKRPKHAALRLAPIRRGEPGYYHTTPNYGGTTFDAIEDTLVTKAVREAEREVNHRLMATLGSQQKAISEERAKERAPKAVDFDLSSPAASTPRATLLRQAAPDSSMDPSTAASGTNNRSTGNVTTDSKLEAMVSELMNEFRTEV